MPESLDAALAALQWLRGQRHETVAAITLLSTRAQRLGPPVPKWPPPPQIADATAQAIAALYRYIDQIDAQHEALTAEVARLRAVPRHGKAAAGRKARPGSPWDVTRRYYRANPGPPFRAQDVLAWAETSGIAISTPAKSVLQAFRLVLSHMATKGELIRCEGGYQPPAANGHDLAGDRPAGP